ncbi:AAA family ATPase [Candidatus Parcubacteria bacterium]|nr:MAG: AAA family ATPase [Candidatus Parcubacteria bacterium]
MFQKATRKQSRLRMTIDGPAGSGKTYTALRFAHALGGRIALIDTERGSASKYVGDAPDGIPWDFDVLNLTVFSPEKYTEAILTAGRAGYSVLVIDSLSHAWEGVGGALEIKQRVGESWSAWRHVTPIHNRMVDAILQSPCHVITTMRSRMEYVQEVDQTTGRIIVRKVGMAPIQRPGTEYEFDLVCDLDWAHIMTVSKSRCPAVADKIVERPGPEFMQPIIEWLSSGVNVPNASMTPNEMQFVETITLDMLLAQYGAEAILAANGGAIPGTQEEINLIAELLRLSQES